MQIIVKTLAGKSISLDVEASDSVDVLRTRIEDKEGVPAHGQKLLVAGKTMEDGYLLADYCLRDGATVHLVHRFRAGQQVSAWHQMAKGPGRGRADSEAETVEASSGDSTSEDDAMSVDEVDNRLPLPHFLGNALAPVLR
mmetsp:Transcript_6734/g.18123  ORF Transcript_6734/g.18123 Transcript_6734/m.18123 type:complete len:140 (-) Transcript_6734:168-587(-)